MATAHPAGIDDADIWTAGPERLSLALMDARNHTLHLLAQYEQAMATGGLTMACEDGLELPQWVGGHIGWLAEYWIGRNPRRGVGRTCPADTVRLASIEPMADRWWDPELMTHAFRWQAALPPLDAVRAYLLETLESTLELLDAAQPDDDGLYFFRAALFHEDWWGEQLIVQAQALGLHLPLRLPAPAAPRGELLVPACRWMLGSTSGGFVQDVEQWAHEVAVPEFEIDAQPVSWGQFVEFVADGGYDRAQLWHPEGWVWLQAQPDGRRAPRFVEQLGVGSGAVLQDLFGRPLRMASQQSAMHLSWWEADAWARWAGRRLATEVEWEVAAHTAANRGFRWGDVREWTAGTLRPWPGFEAAAWTRLTALEAEPAFGLARVQRGVSFAARARMRHPKLRSFALPGQDGGFVGFRSCAL